MRSCLVINEDENKNRSNMQTIHTHTHAIVMAMKSSQVEKAPHDLCEFIFDSVCVVCEVSNKLRLIICIFYPRLNGAMPTGFCVGDKSVV